MWGINEVAKLTGTTSRTLRYYDQIGLLPPTTTDPNGYRRYDQSALIRLQRILLLRDMGLGLEQIGLVVNGDISDTSALAAHGEWLTEQYERIGKQLATVERTIIALAEGKQLMAAELLDGFDHTQYQDEVERRWGKEAYASSDAWWRGLADDQREQFMTDGQDLAAAWTAAYAAGSAADSPLAQDLAKRHIEWITAAWGGRRPTDDQLLGLGEMYVADERFAANYGGRDGARFVRDALASSLARG